MTSRGDPAVAEETPLQGYNRVCRGQAGKSQYAPDVWEEVVLQPCVLLDGDACGMADAPVVAVTRSKRGKKAVTEGAPLDASTPQPGAAAVTPAAGTVGAKPKVPRVSKRAAAAALAVAEEAAAMALVAAQAVPDPVEPAGAAAHGSALSAGGQGACGAAAHA